MVVEILSISADVSKEDAIETVERGWFLVNCPIRIERQFVDDVMCTAIEGGISYWCEGIRRVTEPKQESMENIHMEYYKGRMPLWSFPARGGVMKIDDGDEWHEFTLYHFMRGLSLFIQNHKDGKNPGFSLDSLSSLDAADCIIQYGLFGEITFS